ncbi:MAG: hypothetical protein ACOYIG_03750 [Acetivibrionales bacterium]
MAHKKEPPAISCVNQKYDYKRLRVSFGLNSRGARMTSAKGSMV